MPCFDHASILGKWYIINKKYLKNSSDKSEKIHIICLLGRKSKAFEAIPWIPRIIRHLRYILSIENDPEILKTQISSICKHIVNDHQDCSHKCLDNDNEGLDPIVRLSCVCVIYGLIIIDAHLWFRLWQKCWKMRLS